MDLLGRIGQAGEDKKSAAQENLRGAYSREAPSLLLGWLYASEEIADRIMIAAKTSARREGEYKPVQCAYNFMAGHLTVSCPPKRDACY